MKNLRHVITTLCVAILISLLSACSGLTGSPKTENTGCTVSGNLIISGDATAVRSATTSFDMENLALEFVEPLSVVANPQTQGISSCVATVEKTDSGYSYSVLLPAVGTWDLLVNFVLKKDDSTENVQVLHTTPEITIAEGVTSITKDIIIYPYMRADASGAIKLPITDATGLVSKAVCTAEWKNGPHTEEDLDSTKLSSTVNFTAGKAELVQTKVPTGNYEVTLEFLDSDDNTLYKCKEIIAVFSGFTTDTWSGTGSHLRKTPQGATEFVITDETLSVFGVNDVLLYEPNTIEYNGMGNDESGYDYYLVDISEVSEKPEKTAVPARYSTNYLKNFTAFDSDGNFYLLQTSNDTGVTLSSGAFEWTEPTLGFDNNDYSYIQGFAIDRTNNNICILKLDSTSFVIYDYPELVSSKGTKLPIDYNDHLLNLTYYPLEGFVVNAGIAYLLIRNMDSYDFYRYEFNQYSDPLDSQPVTIDFKTLLGFTSINTNTFKITDMLYQDGAIYILVKNHSEITSGSNAISSEYPIYARGAVIKYDVSSGETNVIGWTETPLDNTGKYLYGFSNSSMPTQLKYNETGENLKFSTSDASSKFPNIYSPSDSDTSFYGPVKFIAIKPKKLIIADDGFAFYTDDEDAYNFKNVNRVVTVDLENFTINAIETNSEFEFDYNYTIIGSGFEASKPNVALDANSTQYEGSSVLLGIPCGDENN